MFSNCTSLTTASEMSATTLEEKCCFGMFGYCTSLTEAPALHSTTLANHCYGAMFYECNSLTEAPALPATILADKCYADMFYHCTSLTTTPALPATTLAEECYSYMFSGCTSLKTIPSLPATTMVSSCYAFMFQGCTSLIVNTTAPGKEWIIPATVTLTGALTNMFSGTSGTMHGTPQVNTVYYIASDSTTAVEDVAADAMEYVVYSNNRQIFVQGAEGRTVALYDLSGRVVAKIANANGTQSFTVRTAGIYLVCVEGMNGAKRGVKKVVVR